MAAQLEIPRRPDPLARVWLLDGETDTYFTIRPLLRETDVVLSADPVNEASWNPTLALIDERYVKPGHHRRITAVGQIHGKLVSRLLALQADGTLTVDIERDPWTFLEAEVQRRGLRVTPMWIGRRDLLGTAAHVAALQSSDQHVVMALWKEAQLARFIPRADKASATIYVIVADLLAPVARPEPTPAALQPVDGRMVPVKIAVNEADSCGDGVSVTLVEARSSDPAGCGGFGDPDIVAEIGRDDRDVLLRAEACEETRTYTLVYELADGAGNRSRYETTVSVERR